MPGQICGLINDVVSGVFTPRSFLLEVNLGRSKAGSSVRSDKRTELLSIAKRCWISFTILIDGV